MQKKKLLTCPVCGHRLTMFCAACRGRAGGKRTSPTKTRAARRNAKLGGRPVGSYK